MIKGIDPKIFADNVEAIIVKGEFIYDDDLANSMSNLPYGSKDDYQIPFNDRKIDFEEEAYILKDGSIDFGFLLATKQRSKLKELKLFTVYNSYKMDALASLKSYVLSLEYILTTLKSNVSINVFAKNYPKAEADGYHPDRLDAIIKRRCSVYKKDLVDKVLNPFIEWIKVLKEVISNAGGIKSAKELIESFSKIKNFQGISRKTKGLMTLNLKEKYVNKLPELFEILKDGWIAPSTNPKDFESIFTGKKDDSPKIEWKGKIGELRLFLHFLKSYCITDDNPYATAKNLFCHNKHNNTPTDLATALNGKDLANIKPFNKLKAELENKVFI